MRATAKIWLQKVTRHMETKSDVRRNLKLLFHILFLECLVGLVVLYIFNLESKAISYLIKYVYPRSKI